MCVNGPRKKLGASSSEPVEHQPTVDSAMSDPMNENIESPPENDNEEMEPGPQVDGQIDLPSTPVSVTAESRAMDSDSIRYFPPVRENIGFPEGSDEEGMEPGPEIDPPIDPPEGDMIAVLTPMTSPSMLNSGPPELPLLIDASVCRKSS